MASGLICSAGLLLHALPMSHDTSRPRHAVTLAFCLQLGQRWSLDAKVRMYFGLPSLKYWTLNLMPLMVYPKVLVGVGIHRYIQ